MWSPSCILEQSRFQPAIVCKTRVLLIASTTVRFIGVAILWVPIASARVVRSTVLRGGGGASSALIAPAGLARAAIGVLDHGGDPCRWRHHSEAEKLPHGKGARSPPEKGPAAKKRVANQSMAVVASIKAAGVRTPQLASGCPAPSYRGGRSASASSAA